MKLLEKVRAKTMKRLSAMPLTQGHIEGREHAYIWSMLLARCGESKNATFDEDFVIQCAGSDNAVCYAFQDNENAIDELEDVSCQATTVTLYTWNPEFYAKCAPSNVNVQHIRIVFH